MADGLISSSSSNSANSLIGQNMKTGASFQALGALGNIMGSHVEYNLLKRETAQLGIEASSVELQAMQEANMLREQFLESIGNYTYGAAQRGVSVGSENVKANIESSAISLGRDIQKKTKSAELKANALRAQRKILNARGKHNLTQSYISGLTSLGMAGMNWQTGNALMGENMAGQSSGWNPATSAPSMKPGR